MNIFGLKITTAKEWAQFLPLLKVIAIASLHSMKPLYCFPQISEQPFHSTGSVATGTVNMVNTDTAKHVLRLLLLEAGSQTVAAYPYLYILKRQLPKEASLFLDPHLPVKVFTQTVPNKSVFASGYWLLNFKGTTMK